MARWDDDMITRCYSENNVVFKTEKKKTKGKSITNTSPSAKRLSVKCLSTNVFQYSGATKIRLIYRLLARSGNIGKVNIGTVYNIGK